MHKIGFEASKKGQHDRATLIGKWLGIPCTAIARCDRPLTGPKITWAALTKPLPLRHGILANDGPWE